MKKAGYYTVEATFIMSVCVWIIVALCYGGFYVHDRIVLESQTNEETAQWLAAENPLSSSSWEKEMKKQWDRQLLLMNIQSVKANNKIMYEKVTVTCELAISFPLLKKILTKNKNQVLQVITREMVVPAKYKWDMEKSQD